MRQPIKILLACSILTFSVFQVMTGQSCTGSASLTVAIQPLPVPAFTFSVDGNTVTFVNTSANATEYIWDFGDNTLASMEANPVHTYATPGDYIVTLLALNSCGNNLTTGNIYLLCPPFDVPVEASGPVSFCEGDQVTLSTSAQGTAYQWYNGATPLPGADAPALSVTESGFYTVTVMDVMGCANESDPVLVSVYANPVFNFTPPVTSFCDGESLLLEGPSGFTAYQWLEGGIPIDGATEPYLVVDESGEYAIQVWNALSCSATSPAAVVTEYDLPEVTILPAGLVVNSAGQDVLLTASSANVAGYQWNTTASGMSISVGYPGIYVVTVTDNNGCTATAFAEVTLDPNSLPYIIEPVPNNLTVENDDNAVSWQWYLNGIAIPGANSPDYQPVESGVYTCYVVYGNNFSSFTPPYDFLITHTAYLQAADIRIQVVPNPADDRLGIWIQSPEADQSALFQLSDALGRKIFSRQGPVNFGESQLAFDIAHLPAGLYRLHCLINGQNLPVQVIIQ